MNIVHPLLRYHGGKFRLAKWIISQMPEHGLYVETHAGAAGVLFQKPAVAGEVINDLEEIVTTVFRALQDEAEARRLQRRLYYTLFSRAEFERTYEPATDRVDFAAKMIVRSFFGFGSDSVTRGYRTGFRAKPSGNRSMPSAAWRAWFEDLPQFTERLRGVTVENRDALEIVARYDSPRTLFYVDPPYVHSTRKKGLVTKSRGYRHELTDAQHRQLALMLRGAKGMVMISGYASALYDELYGDWLQVSVKARADRNAPRTECLWFNPAAASRRPQPQLSYSSQQPAEVEQQ